MIPTLYRGSVKDLLGPVELAGSRGLIFEYTDAYSVFDWGRMPDALARKGEALAVMAADWFERLEKPETWKEFSRSSEAQALRKASRFGAAFNELGEKLQSEGLRTHYLGVLTEKSVSVGRRLDPARLSTLSAPVRHVAVRQVEVVRPGTGVVLGRQVPDYGPTRDSAAPKLIPLEVVFRFSCPPGSSLVERVERDPQYLASRGFPEARVEPGVQWGFPVLEMFTKLEASDRPVTLVEALAISGLEAAQLQEMLFATAWVSALLRSQLAKLGLELADGKLEWALDERGRCFLVDAIGPDELRILKDGVQLSKEFLRGYYRETPWYDVIQKAKAQAQAQGVADWKRLAAAPGALPSGHLELATQVYLSLANAMTGKAWFPEAWPLDRVIEKLKTVGGKT